MLIAILRGKDVQIVDTEEAPVVFVLSMGERAQVVDVCGKVLEGNQNNLVHYHHNLPSANAEDESEKRRKGKQLRETLAKHPKFKAYVTEEVRTGPQIITKSEGIALPRNFLRDGGTGFG